RCAWACYGQRVTCDWRPPRLGATPDASATATSTHSRQRHHAVHEWHVRLAERRGMGALDASHTEPVRSRRLANLADGEVTLLGSTALGAGGAARRRTT